MTMTARTTCDSTRSLSGSLFATSSSTLIWSMRLVEPSAIRTGVSPVKLLTHLPAFCAASASLPPFLAIFAPAMIQPAKGTAAPQDIAASPFSP
ncbi:hypothetical protein ADK67_40245 [Saccharothrix sp. NRRL B-16348]|nr:hypothetical protein ADK67_40245 [Saccharothrix sp. NRRL B-16348]